MFNKKGCYVKLCPTAERSFSSFVSWYSLPWSGLCSICGLIEWCSILLMHQQLYSLAFLFNKVVTDVTGTTYVKTLKHITVDTKQSWEKLW